MKCRFIPLFALCIGCGQEVAQPPESPPISAPEPAVALPTADELFAQGRALQARADFNGAESRYRQAMTAAPNNPQYAYYLGTVLHATSRYGEARSLFERAIELKSDYAAPRIALGKLLYDVDGQAEAAGALLQQALQIAPQAAEARYTLALIHLREGRADEAIALFSQLVQTDTSNAQARAQLGLAYLQRGDVERAQLELQQAADAQPYYSTAYHGLGQTFIRQGKADIGQRLLLRAQQLEEEATQLTPHLNALRQNPNQPQAHYNLAIMYARFSRLRDAAQHFGQTIELDSTFAPAYQGLGNLYQRLGTTPEARASYAGKARALYLRALQIDPKLADTHNNLGLLLHSAGDVQAAVHHYEQATQIDPQAGFYQANLSRGYYDTERYEDALGAVRRALQIDPTLAGARETLGDIFAAEENWSEALEAWEAIEQLGTSPQLEQKIARARSRLGR